MEEKTKENSKGGREMTPKNKLYLTSGEFIGIILFYGFTFNLFLTNVWAGILFPIGVLIGSLLLMETNRR